MLRNWIKFEQSKGSTSTISIKRSNLEIPKGHEGNIVGVYNNTTENTETDENGKNPELRSAHGVSNVHRARPLPRLETVPESVLS